MRNILTPSHVKRYLQKALDSNASLIELGSKLNSIKLGINWAVKNKYLEPKAFEEITAILEEFENKHLIKPLQKKSISTRIRERLSKSLKDIHVRYAIPSPLNHSNEPSRYLGGLVLIIFTSVLAAGLYTRFFIKPSTPFAYATNPTKGGRVLSFQGRLTDSLGNPITTSTNVQFKLYTGSSGGSPLYSTGSCAVTPDQDGIFNTLIGSSCGSEIDSSVFTENATIYMGTTVGSDTEMTPRQQIANVGYAINAETLQGLPPGTNISNIPYINKDGDMLINVSAPGIRSSYASANFNVTSALGINIQSAGAGDITLNASQSGTLLFKNSSHTSTFDANGDLKIGGGTFNNSSGSEDLYVTGNLEADGVIYGNGSGLTSIGQSNITADSLDFTEFQDTLDLDGSLTLNQGTGTWAQNFTGTTGPALTYTASGAVGTGNAAGIELNVSNASTSVPGFLLRYAGSSYALRINDDGTTTDTSPFVIDSSGLVGIGTTTPAQALDIASANSNITFSSATGPHQILTGGSTHLALMPGGSVGIGYTAPGTKLTVSGGLAVGTTAAASTYLTKIAPDGGAIFEGNVGIGTTSPSAPLDVTGDIYLTSGLSTFRTAVSDGTVEATKFCTGDGETNCVTDFSTLSGSANIWTDGGTYIYPTNGEVLGNSTSAGSNKIAGLYLADSAPLYFGTDNDVNFSFSGSTLTVAQGANNWAQTFTGTTGPGYTYTASGAVTQGNAAGIELNISNASTSVPAMLIRNAGSSYALRINDDGTTTDTSPFVVDASGQVGIGTTTPGAALEVNGNILADGNVTIGDASGDSVTVNSASWTFANDTNITVSGGTAGINFDTNTLSIDAANDRIGIGTTAPSQVLDLAAANANLTFSSATGPHQILTGGSTNLALMPGGSLGIGYTAPGSKLTVSGGLAVGTTAAASTYLTKIAPDGGAIFEGNVGIGTTSPSAPLSVGVSSQFQVSSVGAVTAVGVNSGSGLLQGTGGITITGTGSINATGTSGTSIGNSTGTLSLVGGASSIIDFANFDVATTGNITVATGQGLDTNASGALGLGNGTATSINIGNTAATTINIGAGGNLTRTFNIGTGTGADTINIGTGTTSADTINIGTGAVANTISIGSSSTTGLSLTDDNWNITTAGAANFVSLGATTRGSGQFTTLDANGNVTIGDAAGDSVTANAATWTFANDTNFVLSGGVNGLSMDTTTFSVDATNDRVGIGTTGPGTKLTVGGGLAVGTTAAASTYITQAAPDGGAIFEGNVGIGTTNPGSKLELVGTFSQTGANTFSTGTGAISLNGDTTIAAGKSLALASGIGTFTQTFTGTTGPAFTITASGAVATGNAAGMYLNVSNASTSVPAVLISNAGSSYALRVNDDGTTTDTSPFVIDASGNVGIGNTTPTGKLHVVLPAFSSHDTDSQMAIFGSGTSGYGLRIGYNETNNYSIINTLKPSVAWGNTILQNGGGNVGIGNTSPTAKLTVAGGALIGYTEGTAGVTSNSLAVSGSIGIGTTSPTEKLSIISGNPSSPYSGVGLWSGASNAYTAYTIGRTVGSVDGYLGVSGGAGHYVTDSAAGDVMVLSNGGKLNLGAYAQLSTMTLTGGSVGIGTTSPGSKLTIRGSLAVGTTSVSSTYLSKAAPDGGAIFEGVVGIGTTSPGSSYKLNIAGNINATTYYAGGAGGQSGSCGANEEPVAIGFTNGIMTTWGGCDTGMVTDLAESYPSHELLEKGDLVQVDNNYTGYVQSSQSRNNNGLIGIITTRPWKVLGIKGDALWKTVFPVALTGRVPVKVTTLNGTIKQGDGITSSDIHGYGMKQAEPGTIVGTALESTSEWNEYSCPAVSSIEAINWPDDNGQNENKPCYRLPDNTYVGKIMVFANTTWHEQVGILTSTGELQLSNSIAKETVYSGNLAENSQDILGGTYSLVDKSGQAVTSVLAAGQGLFGKVQTGLLDVQNAVVKGTLVAADTITTTLQSTTVKTSSLIASSIQSDSVSVTDKITSPVIDTDNIHIKDTATSEKVETNVIKPQTNDLTIDLNITPTPSETGEAVGPLAKLLIKGREGREVASIDAAGNASFSGTIAASQVQTDKVVSGEISSDKLAVQTGRINSLEGDEASLSGKLSAREITSDNIQKLTSDVNSVQQLLADLQNQPLPDPQYYQNISSDMDWRGNNITATGNTNLYNASVTNIFTAGNIMMENNSILALASDLHLSSLSTITLFDNAVVIAKDGTITTQGTIIAKKGLKTNTIQASDPGKDVNVILGTAGSTINETETRTDNQKFAITNNIGIEVASVDASGSAHFNDIALNKYVDATSSATVIASAQNFAQNGIFAPAIETNMESAGIGIIPATEMEVIIYNKNISDNSLIYLTPNQSIPNGQLSVVQKNTCKNSTDVACKPYFKVSSGTMSEHDLKFNWLIIN